ncbi:MULTISPECIES: DUF1015 domain-containing protein [Clostridium]|jgi:uncharacterized protein (DUF1015 family)|uniref:DUF1015 domain-containing protein n=1 Tax=Clostridium lapidicellarium TaxID=3240931 RepID=A0ABV4E049_9CLOT|nr:DUF1015 family protein [uncultured Clostridium sp.]NLU07710.1 DUF1015 domain-containing protein [Clostridiales bacterium]
MAVLRPFKAIRPRKDLASRVAELPYDVMSSEEARKIAKNNVYSFLHVDKAEIDLDENVDIYDKKVYEKANENLNKMISHNILIQDGKNNFYIYRLTVNGKSQTGIVGCTSIDDYIDNKIKKHECTRKNKEQDRTNHIGICNANTGPIFLTYRYNDEINDVVNMCIREKAVYDFTACDGVRHEVWVVDDDGIIEKICNLFKGIDTLYIADGHHRAASAVKVGIKRREENPNYSGDEEFNFFLSVLFPDSDLNIISYNRVVDDLNGFSTEEYLSEVSKRFYVETCGGKDGYNPFCKGTYGMYLCGKWYKLTAKEGTYNSADPVDKLDVSILQNNLLSPILGIDDPRTNSRISFVGGIRGLGELEQRAKKSRGGVAFSMYPTTLKELMNIADSGRVMPPKSTWFEPKLRSGLFIHKLK